MTTPHSAPLSSLQGLEPVWEQFRRGGCVRCPVEGGPMALAVDGANDAYRFVCVHCGYSSPWFEAGLSHLAIRGAPGTDPGTGDG